MSPNARRRRPKIVAPLTPNREQELIGGLKNALERGEPITKAKRTFINAGYKPEEVEGAAQKISSTSPTPQTIPSRPTNTSNIPTIQPVQTTIGGQKKISKKLLIILITSGALILIGATLLGIFWENLVS